MGFYGKIFQQIVDGFQSLKFSNKGKNSYDFPTEVEDDIVLEAGVTADRAVVTTGNAWLSVKDSLEERNTVAIYHNEPGGATKTFESFKLTPEAPQAYPIAFGDVVSFGNIEYDAAGHIAKISESAFVMPTAPDLDGIRNINEDIAEINKVIGLPLPAGVTISPSIREQLVTLNENADKITELDALVQSGNDNLLDRTTALEDANEVYNTKLGTLSKIQVTGVEGKPGIADIIGEVELLASGESDVWGETHTLVGVIQDLMRRLKMAELAIETLDNRTSTN